MTIRRLKHLTPILLVNAGFVLIGVVILELVFGAWWDSARLNRLNLIKDTDIHYDLSELYEAENPIISYSRDKYGLRGRHTAPNDIDILTIGGSTTEQRYLRAGETWQDVLQDHFAEAGEFVQIANAGVDGQSTFGHIKNFQWWFPDVPGLEPQFVIFYIGLNDLYLESASRYDDLVGEEPNMDIMQTIRDRSALWHLARTIRGTYRAIAVYRIWHHSIDLDQLEWTYQPLIDDYEFMQSHLEAYANRLRLLASYAAEMGATPIFVSQPFREFRVTPEGIEGAAQSTTIQGREINGVDRYHIQRILDRVTQTVAQETGVHFVDLGADTDWVDDDFYDFNHMTPQGARKVGTRLYAQVNEIVRAAR